MKSIPSNEFSATVRALGKPSPIPIGSIALLVAAAFGCSAESRPKGDGVTLVYAGSDGQGQAAGGVQEAVGGAYGAITSGSGGVTGSGGSRATNSKTDLDGDGFSTAQGDCDDEEPLINPGAYDFPGNGLDEDCDKNDATEDAASACDAKLAIDSSDAKDGARAMGLCRFVDQKSRGWGVISAKYTDASGKANPSNLLQIGILPDFGPVTPHEGKRFLALSSGAARAPDQPGYTAQCDEYSIDATEAPTGYPKEPPSCKGFNFWGLIKPVPYDAVALSLEIRVPTNAKTLTFQSNFYTYEYPDYICSSFNDFFVVMMDPTPSGLADGNIAFDQDNNPISVNNSYLRVCEPGERNGRTFTCPLGTADLMGTGYDGTSTCVSGATNGATGWLLTTVPVTGGSVIKLRFAIWDTSDSTLDSSVLVDNFRWSIEKVNKPVTIPLM